MAMVMNLLQNVSRGSHRYERTSSRGRAHAKRSGGVTKKRVWDHVHNVTTVKLGAAMILYRISIASPSHLNLHHISIASPSPSHLHLHHISISIASPSPSHLHRISIASSSKSVLSQSRLALSLTRIPHALAYRTRACCTRACCTPSCRTRMQHV